MLFVASTVGAILFFVAGYATRSARVTQPTVTSVQTAVSDAEVQTRSVAPAVESAEALSSARPRRSPRPSAPRPLKSIFEGMVANHACSAAVLSDDKGFVIEGCGAGDIDTLAATVGMLHSGSNSALGAMWLTSPTTIDLGDDKRGWLSSRSFDWHGQRLFVSVFGEKQALNSNNETEMLVAARNYVNSMGAPREANHA